MTSEEPKTPSATEADGADTPDDETRTKRKKKRKQKSSTQTIAGAGLSRATRIVSVLTRNGFHQFIPKKGIIHFLGKRLFLPDAKQLVALEQPDRAARRFRLVLEELGPSFIKMGQILSTRPDLLPTSFVRELETLQDNAPPLDFSEIQAAIETGLGHPISELYRHFEEIPLACASIAQVHRATTFEGDEVVVKVIRPGIRQVIAADLDLLHLLARILEATFAEMELYAPGELVSTFDRALKSELDFRGEADAIEEVARNLANIDDLVVPKVYRELSSVGVLTLELLRGVKVSEVERGSARAKKMIRVGLEATFQQIFIDGLYHGDPHPGNLMALDDGRLGLIDFGLVGRLSSVQQDILVALLVSIVSGDVDGIARVVLRMGRAMGRIDLEELRERVAEIRREHLQASLKDVDAAKFVQDLIVAGQEFRIRVAPEYAILAKSAVTMEGVLRSLDPDLDILQTARPFATKLIRERYNPRRVIESSLRTVMGMASFVRDAPKQLDQIMLDLKSGTMRFDIQNESLGELGGQLNVLATRVFMALLAGSLFISASIMAPDDPLAIGGFPTATVLALLTATFLSGVGLAWHALGAGSGKLSLSFLGKLLQRRKRLPD